MSIIKKKVYVVGSVRGVHNWQEKFKKYKKHFEDKGYEVKTPLNYPAGKTEEEYMRLSCTNVLWADVIYVAPESEHSLGTKAEIAIAESCGKSINYIKEFL
ncbi:MAG: DUF4406 domain-containing protein [Dehalococcoidia bacterium]